MYYRCINLTIIVIPGVHPTDLTDSFVRGIRDRIKQNLLVLPTESYLPYDAIAVYRWLDKQQLSYTRPSSFICFSAGVVGGFGAALAWQLRGGKIHSFIAIDGWGVPLVANFPIYRISHDYFTHWSSAILGGGSSSFYAEPAVEHLDIWRSPETCKGWRQIAPGWQTRDPLTNYLVNVLNS